MPCRHLSGDPSPAPDKAPSRGMDKPINDDPLAAPIRGRYPDVIPEPAASS